MEEYNYKAKVIGIYSSLTRAQVKARDAVKGEIERIGYVDSTDKLHELVKPAVALLDAADTHPYEWIENAEVEGVGNKLINHKHKEINYYIEAQFIFKGDLP